MKQNNFLKSFWIFSFFTFLSRIFGFARDIVNARVLGVSELSDMFFVAFKLPNLFRSLFAEGAMNSAFVPIYSQKLANNDFDTPRFSSRILVIMFLFLSGFCLIADFFMPEIIKLMAPGFNFNSPNFQTGIQIARIMFPFLFLISLTSVFSCLLQSHCHFMPSSAYPIIMNIVLIIASFLSFNKIYSLSWAVIISGILQLFFMIFFIKFYKIPIEFKGVMKNLFNDDVKLFFKKLLPSILTTCVTRIGITIDTIIASKSVDAVSFIYYADRLYQLPLSIIGTTISTVMLPNFSKSLVTCSREKISEIQNKIFEFTFLLVIPATFGLCILSFEICSLLFGSNIEIKNLNLITLFLSILSLALPFNVLNNILNSIFFANQITKIATKISIYVLISNVIINIVLFQYIGFFSVAVSTIISSLFNTLLLLIFGIKRQIIFIDKNIFVKLAKVLFLNLFLTVIMVFINRYKSYIFQNFSALWYASIFFEIMGFIGIYFGILYFVFGYRVSYFKKIF